MQSASRDGRSDVEDPRGFSGPTRKPFPIFSKNIFHETAPYSLCVPKPATSYLPKFTIRASRAVVIDVYDILQLKEDKPTVPIYYGARLAKIDLEPEERPKIDPNFEEVTENAEEPTTAQ